MRILLSNISGLATLHHIGFVFQDYALFRHMIESDNVTFGIRVQDKKVFPSETETANPPRIIRRSFWRVNSN